MTMTGTAARRRARATTGAATASRLMIATLASVMARR